MTRFERVLSLGYRTGNGMGKKRYDAELDEIEAFFDETRYDLTATHQDQPGKDLLTVHDPRYGGTGTVLWEGDRAFGYVTEDGARPLSADEELYDVACRTMDLYERGLVFDTVMRPRFRMATMSNSPGAMRALNEPMAWGVETGNRTWNDRTTGLFGWLRDAFSD